MTYIADYGVFIDKHTDVGAGDRARFDERRDAALWVFESYVCQKIVESYDDEFKHVAIREMSPDPTRLKRKMLNEEISIKEYVTQLPTALIEFVNEWYFYELLPSKGMKGEYKIVVSDQEQEQ